MPEFIDPHDCTPEQRVAAIQFAFDNRELTPVQKAVHIGLVDSDHRFFGIWWDFKVKAPDKLILLRLRFAERTGQLPPRLEEIAADTGYHIPLVQGALRRLMKAGIVVWADRP